MARLLIFAMLLLVATYGLLMLRRGAPLRSSPGHPPRSRMSRAEALQVLGLGETATKRDVALAHRELIRKVHPDTPGGSTYLASQINQARDVLLG